MPKQWDDDKFKKWLSLREHFKNAKRSKDDDQIIRIGLLILSFANTASFIGIMTPLFHRDIGNAYLRNNDKIKALDHYQAARTEFIEYRNTHNIYKQNDCIKDIETLDKKIKRIEINIKNKK